MHLYPLRGAWLKGRENKLLAQDLAQWIEDRLDSTNSRVLSQGKLDCPIDDPDLSRRLRLGDRVQGLVGNLGEILDQYQVFCIVRNGLGFGLGFLRTLVLLDGNYFSLAGRKEDYRF